MSYLDLWTMCFDLHFQGNPCNKPYKRCFVCWCFSDKTYKYYQQIEFLLKTLHFTFEDAWLSIRQMLKDSQCAPRWELFWYVLDLEVTCRLIL